MVGDHMTLKGRCNCGANTFHYDVPRRAFPLTASICHCTSCRKVSGQIFVTTAIVPDAQPNLSTLSSYASSSWLTRYLCPTCGAQIGDVDMGVWEFMGGTFDSTRDYSTVYNSLLETRKMEEQVFGWGH